MGDDRQMQGLTRAQVLKRGIAAAGALTVPAWLAACGGGGGSGGSPAATSPIGAPKMVNGKLDFGGVEIKGLGDEFLGPIWEWYGDDLEQEANIKIAKPASFGFGTESQAITPKLIGNSDAPWNVISYAAWFLGDFVATGGLEPLDKYLENMPGYAEYDKGVMPVYREMVAKSRGQIYGLMADGDSHALHYRESYFKNKTLQKAYRKQFGRELTQPPKTWDEYIELAGFLTKQLKGDNVYGTQWATEPAVSWTWWLDVAGQRGLRYFDENMQPQINSEAGVSGLEVLLKLAEYSPPGMDNMSIPDTISNWTEGRVATGVWFQDLTEFDSDITQNDSADVALPGSEQPDGSILSRSGIAFNRCFSIPKNQPEEVKQAAVWAAYRLSHPDYSTYSVADPFCGLEPYHEAHLTPEAITQFTKPNPKRGTAKAYPKNNGIFRSQARAKNHVDAIRDSIKNGFPQPNWPGAGEYIRVLGTEIQSAAAGQKSAKEALDAAAGEWSAIVDKRGKEEQQQFYSAFLSSAKKLGL
jgi:multiple sugar transport system substrate-binding protein